MKPFRAFLRKRSKVDANISGASSVTSTDNPKPLSTAVSVENSTETAPSLHRETVGQELEPDTALQQQLETDISTFKDADSAKIELKDNSPPSSSVDEGDQITPAQDASKEGEETTLVPLKSTPNLAQLPPTATGVSAQRENLWDEAYDSLTLEAPELVTKYEEILLSISGGHADAISHSDTKVRWQQMCRLLSTWLENRNNDGTGRLQNLLRDHVEESTGRSLSSALAWTPLCYASSVLAIPRPETQSICLEFIRVISKMDWYASLSKLSISQDEGRDEEDSLRKRIVDLYTSILSYGMNALVRSLDLSHDSEFTVWEEISARLKVAEEDLSLFGGRDLKQLLDNAVVLDGKKGKRRGLATEKYPTLARKFLKQLKRLGYVDPRMGLQEVRVEKKSTVQGLLQLVCSTPQYKSVVDWDGGMSTVLLISGPPGIGKTTLMEAIVRHLLDDADVKGSKQKETELDQDPNTSNRTDPSDAASSNRDSDDSDSDSSDSDSRSSVSTDSEEEISTMSEDVPCALAYYFCGRTGHGLDNSARVLRSLIYSLLQQQPRLISHLRKMKRSTGRDRLDNSNDFIALFGVFFQMLKDERFPKTYFVLDGINEQSSNDDEHGLNDLLQLIHTAVKLQPKARWIVSADADTNVGIECQLRGVERFEHLVLEDILRDAPTGTLDRGVHNIVSDLFKQRSYEAELRITIQQLLCEKSGGNTIWSVIACATLKREDNWYALEVLQEMPRSLEDLYEYARAGIAKLPRRDPEFCNTVLSVMAIALRPLSLEELARLADLPPLVDIGTIVERCGSFLEVQEGIVKFVNPSARHNLRKRYSEPGLSQAHSLATRKALASLTAGFRQGQTRPEDLTNRYETLHWLMHLLNVDDVANDDATANSVIRFFEDYFLSWLDVMIQGSLHTDAGTLMRRLETLLLSKHQNDQSTLLQIVQDARRIIHSHTTNKIAIHPDPRTVIFYPDDSALKQRWLAKHKAWLITPPITAKRWGDNSPIMTGHGDWVRSIAVRPDGRILASGSDDTTVRIWDVETGAAQLTIQGHHDWVMSVAFSISGQLATGSDDGVICIWDPSTGDCLQTLSDQAGKIRAIRFSPDGKKLAAGTSGGLLLWDISDLAQPLKIELESGSMVQSLDFSPTGQWIAAAWEDNTVKIWDATVNKLHYSLGAHDDSINSVAFSPDGKYVASGSDDEAVNIWDVKTGQLFHTFDCEAPVLSVAFSPNPLKLSVAAGSLNRAVNIWDLSTKELTAVMKGHQRYVRTVAFLGDDLIASGSDDSTIRLWRSDGDTAKPVYSKEDSVERGYVNLVAISPDGLYMASASGSFVYLWDGITGQPMEHHILSEHDGTIKSIVFSPEGKRLVSTSTDATVRLWDVASGTSLQVFQGHADWVRSAAFSLDGRYIASASDDGTVRIWDSVEKEGEREPRLLEGHGGYVRAVAFSPDGKLLASGGDDHMIRIWDFASLKLLCELESGSIVIAMLFSPDSSRVVSRSDDGAVTAWDVSTGERIDSPIHTEGVSRYALFDPRIPGYMLTEFGVYLSGPDSSSFFSDRSTHGNLYGISALGDSITCNGRKVIPIPERYEPTASWVQGQVVAFGTRSGEVLLFRFSTADEPS
ncbi:hypothetical protein J3F83DRAFT_739731 [Trichoderma novae-zelandiae]